MGNAIEQDVEALIATIANLFAEKGQAREVAVLAAAKASISETDYDNWDGGRSGYTITLALPTPLFSRLSSEREEIQTSIRAEAASLMRVYPATWLVAVEIVPELNTDPGWRDKAKAWLAGSNVNNQGRVRSDNIASRECDGLLFRSQPEINLYKALKELGLPFAPLPVFIRGGQDYRRIEPDFLIFSDGLMLHVEVDGDTVHHESPVEAHARTAMLSHEGAIVERVSASDCMTIESARLCAKRLLAIAAKVRKQR